MVQSRGQESIPLATRNAVPLQKSGFAVKISDTDVTLNLGGVDV